MLIGQYMKWKNPPEVLVQQRYLDLESDLPDLPRDMKKLIDDFKRQMGSRYYLLLIPAVPLPDASFSQTTMLMVEQGFDGNIHIYQERMKSRSGGMAAQIYRETTPQFLFLKKSDLAVPLKPTHSIRSSVVTAYSEPKIIIPERGGARGL
jgi:hypothetical protein